MDPRKKKSKKRNFMFYKPKELLKLFLIKLQNMLHFVEKQNISSHKLYISTNSLLALGMEYSLNKLF